MYTVKHAPCADPVWYALETCRDLQQAVNRARNYGLDHGGYVCVTDSKGYTVYGTDPVALERHRNVREGCCG